MGANTVIQWRRDTAANWTSVNPVLAQGEAGFETDTKKFKIGDGTTTWSVLSYFSSGGLVVSDTAPASPTTGSLWFDSSEGRTYAYYDSFWVETNPSTIGATGPSNSLTIGTVTTGATSSATLTGVSPNQVLNLVLQKGDTGSTGGTGTPGSDAFHPFLVI